MSTFHGAFPQSPCKALRHSKEGQPHNTEAVAWLVLPKRRNEPAEAASSDTTQAQDYLKPPLLPENNLEHQLLGLHPGDAS